MNLGGGRGSQHLEQFRTNPEQIQNCNRGRGAREAVLTFYMYRMFPGGDHFFSCSLHYTFSNLLANNLNINVFQKKVIGNSNFFSFIFNLQCSGPSMEPTIQNSDIVFSENLSRHFYCIRKYAPLLRLDFTFSLPELVNNCILSILFFPYILLLLNCNFS